MSSAIDNLENAAFQEETTSSETLHPQSRRGRRAYPKAIQRLDNNHDVQQAPLDIEELSKSFHHMIPPPPPQPMGDDPFSKPTVPSRRRDFSPAVEQRTYATTLTITERTLPNGEKTYQASISPIRSVPSRPRLTRRNSASPSSSPSHLSQTTTTTTIKPNEITMIDITPPSSSAPPPPSSRQPFLDRMHKRQQVWEDGLTGKKREIWRAISVKRQRKLKMKKHKYKKLMRKTRNLRRRLDRN